MPTKRVTAGCAWRERAFEGSRTFKEALVVVQHDLQRAAEMHPSDVMAFLSWVRKNGLTISRGQIGKKINAFHKDVRASLRLYTGFLLRFHVYLKFTRRDGALEFVPIYEVPRHSQLMVVVRGGELIPPPAAPDEDARDLLASIGGMPAQIRWGVKRKRLSILMSEQSDAADAELMESGWSEEKVAYLRAAQRRRGNNPEDAKLRFVEIECEETSSVSQLLDVAYDPLSITFLLVGSRGQTRLMCLVGELVSNAEWNQLGAVRASVHERLWGKAPAGAPVDFQQFAQDLDRIPPDGKITNDCVITASGSESTAADMTRTEQRLRRAKRRSNLVRRQIAF